jgi:hypothetical protein
MPGTMNIKELDPTTIKQLGLEALTPEAKADKGNRFRIEQVRQYSIRVMATLEKLTQAERLRVLEHAIRVNEV